MATSEQTNLVALIEAYAAMLQYYAYAAMLQYFRNGPHIGFTSHNIFYHGRVVIHAEREKPSKILIL